MTTAPSGVQYAWLDDIIRAICRKVASLDQEVSFVVKCHRWLKMFRDFAHFFRSCSKNCIPRSGDGPKITLDKGNQSKIIVNPSVNWKGEEQSENTEQKLQRATLKIWKALHLIYWLIIVKNKKDLSALHGELNDHGAIWIFVGYGQCVCTRARRSQCSGNAYKDNDKQVIKDIDNMRLKLGLENGGQCFRKIHILLNN
jgi:hypothetical protein